MKARFEKLRNVCLDNVLPSGNWDDCYVQTIELACELRSL